MKDIASLVSLLPTIIEYVVPGYIFVALWLFFTSRSIKSESFHIVACVVISAGIKIVDRFIYHTIPFLSKISLSQYWKQAILIVTAIIFGILTAKITTARWFSRLCAWISHKSIHDSLFREIINYDGCSLILKCHDGRTITGKLNSHEEKGTESLFALTDYVIEYPRNDQGVIEKYDSAEYGTETALIIKFSDIETFQVFNGKRAYHKEKKNKA